MIADDTVPPAGATRLWSADVCPAAGAGRTADISRNQENREPENADHVPLRMTFTLPGSASLGAFQAGAVCAVSETIRELKNRGREVHVDAVGGASAGSIVAMMFAFCLVEGLDPTRVLRQAWIDEVDVDTLRAGRSDSPLGFEQFRDEFRSFLTDRSGQGVVVGEPIALHIGLTNLLGLTYPVETAHSESEGITFVDWAQFVLEPHGGLDQLFEPKGRAPLDFVLASASHPGAFAPVLIDRSDDRQHYLDNGITNFPESGALWYTDGGLVESEPIGRVVQLGRRQAGEADGIRMHLVIDPRSSGPSGSETWHNPDADLSWLAGARRSLSILPTQALQDDLRAVAATNQRLERIEKFVEKLGPVLPAEADAVLDQLIDGDSSGCGIDTRAKLRHALKHLAGVRDKEQVDVELISPLELSEQRQEGVSDLLAGDFIGAFGGFLSQDIRRSDFALGWESARAWIPGGLERHGVDDSDISAICKRLEHHEVSNEGEVKLDDDGLSAVDLSGHAHLVRLAGRIGRILVAAATPDPTLDLFMD